jgi:hypothetical protein
LNENARLNETNEIYNIENFRFPECTFTMVVKNAMEIKGKPFDLKKHVEIKTVDVKII